MAAGSGRRARFLLAGVLALALLVAGSLYLAGGAFFRGSASGAAAGGPRATPAACGAATTSAATAGRCAGTPAGVVLAAPPAVVTKPPGQARPLPSRPASPPSPRPGAPATGTADARPSAPVATSIGSPAPQDAAAAAQVLALINQARSAAGLPALTITSGLEASSAAHTLRMVGGCGLSHQCPGEAPLRTRETDEGVSATAAGENIGEGGPVADTPAAIAQMAVVLTQSMLNEKPPDDGHRMNILSSIYTHIGIAVYRDSSGTVWLTQDFSN